MMYDIKLKISYDYADMAVGSRQIVCVLPTEVTGQQRLVAALLDIQPRPEERVDRFDFFGNRVVEIANRAPHKGIVITLHSRVERVASGAMPAGSVSVLDLKCVLADHRDLGPASPLHFLSPSFRIPINSAMTAFARRAIDDEMSVAEAIVAVGQALHSYMKFNAKATTVDTPAAQAFARREGVCQDFSHILITCLRGVGIPAGYVSGFLRTVPPPGKPRLEGADAMHAWVCAWCGPAAGWLEFDPTNNTIAGPDHIFVARGRDYSDVSPIKGVLRISGKQKSKQEVDVIPIIA